MFCDFLDVQLMYVERTYSFLKKRTCLGLVEKGPEICFILKAGYFAPSCLFD